MSHKLIVMNIFASKRFRGSLRSELAEINTLVQFSKPIVEGAPMRLNEFYTRLKNRL